GDATRKIRALPCALRLERLLRFGISRPRRRVAQGAAALQLGEHSLTQPENPPPDLIARSGSPGGPPAGKCWAHASSARSDRPSAASNRGTSYRESRLTFCGNWG